MKPNIGDIYCVYVERISQYTACQVTMVEEKNSIAILELDWVGHELPDEAELQTIKPLVCHYYFWNEQLDHCLVDANVPPHYILVGNMPPLVTEQTNSYSGWHIGGSTIRQRRWNLISEERRQSFKEAANDKSLIEIGRGNMRRDTSTVNDDILQSLDDMFELEKLPCLTQIHANGYYESLLSFVKSNPIINQLYLENHGHASVDVRESNLEKLIIDTEGLEELYLNEGLEELSFVGVLSPNLTIHAHQEGQWITANCSAISPIRCGLNRLGSLHLRNVTELDLMPIVQSFPELRELRMWGKPGMVSNIHSLEQLVGLQGLSTYDLFGFEGDQFPGPDKLSNLSWLWLTSLPADAARMIKSTYKKEVAKGLDLSISKPRKPEWLAENVSNPFRDWDGRENITVANAKKAVQLYKKMLAGIHTLEKQFKDGTSSANRPLVVMVTEYTEAFNKMDRKTGFIETEEREEIYIVLEELLDHAVQRLGDIGIDTLDRDKLLETFNTLRDF
jgi:hypothetical protein